MNNDIIPIGRLIDVNNIRYNVLQEITKEEFKDSNIKIINLYIDMYSILKSLYRNTNYVIDDYSAVTSSIVNICSHYRRFYWSRYNVHTRIFIINSHNISDINTQLVFGYNNGFKQSLDSNVKARDMINNNIDILRLLVPYLPDIYFIDTTYEAGVVMYNLMCRDDKLNEKAHIILSKDPYLYQLVAMKPNTVVLRKKDKDTSIYINKDNLLSIYLKERKVKENDTIVSPELFSVLLAMSSLKQRNIKSVTSISKAIDTLEKAIKDHRITNAYNNDINYLWNSY